MNGIENVFLHEKGKGQTVAPIDAVISLLESVKHDVSSNPQYIIEPSFLATQWTSESDKSIAAYNARCASSLEMFKSVIAYGQMALKGAMWINGGAAVAILALIGNLWGKVSDPLAIFYLVNSVTMFASGVLVAGLAIGITYITQCGYAAEDSKPQYKPWARIAHGFSIFFALSSFVLFAIGIYQANEAFIINIIKAR